MKKGKKRQRLLTNVVNLLDDDHVKVTGVEGIAGSEGLVTWHNKDGGEIIGYFAVENARAARRLALALGDWAAIKDYLAEKTKKEAHRVAKKPTPRPATRRVRPQRAAKKTKRRKLRR